MLSRGVAADSIELRATASTAAGARRRDSDAAFLLNSGASDGIDRSNSDAGFVAGPTRTLSRHLSLTEMQQHEAAGGDKYERTSYQFWHNTLLELGYEKTGESFMERESVDMGALSFASAGASAALATETKRASPPPTTAVAAAAASAIASRVKPASRLLRAASRTTSKNGMRSPYDSNNDGTADGMVLFQYFDLTPTRMRELFQHWDVDHDGTITYEELLEGLRAQKLDLPVNNRSTRNKVRAIFGHAKDDKKMEITISEFSTFLHRTKLAMLFHEPLRRGVYTRIKGHQMFMHEVAGAGGRPPSVNTTINDNNNNSHNNKSDGKVYRPSAELLIIDYSKNDLKIHCANPSSEEDPLPFTLDHEEARNYFFGSRNIQSSSVRWVSVERPDPISIITIAVKYRLHPLALEDMLSLSAQRPKIDKYGAHYFLILPAFRLTAHAYRVMRSFDMSDENLCDQWKGQALLEKQNFALCVAGTNRFDPSSSYDTVISVEGGFAPFGMNADRAADYTRNATEHYEGSMHVLSDDAGTEDGSGIGSLGNGLFRKALFRQLGTDFSRLRMQRSVFMMYSLIDAAVAQLAPVIDMYRMRLDWYTQMIRTKKWRFGNRIRGLLDTKRELEKLCEQIRPCISVVRHLINDDGLAPSAAVIAAMGRPRRNDRSADADSGADAASSPDSGAQKEMSSSPLPPQRTSPLWDETLHKLHALGRIGFSAVGGSGSSSEKRQLHQGTPAAHQPGDVVGDSFFGLAEIKQYFEDIDDALAMNLDDLRRMADLCASYTTEFESYGDKRMNDILFVLTIVTTLFVPAQFFTGVFGMNFVKPDGTPNMPLLTWRYGYFFFWMLSLTLTALTFLGLFVQGWMPCERCNRCADRLSRDEES